MININSFQELVESMDIIAENKLKNASQIYYCLVKSVVNKECTIIFNNKQYTVPFFGGTPTPNKTYALFLPQNNINQAFVIGEGGSGGGGGGSGIAIQPDPPLGDELVWIDTDDPGQLHIIPEIKDNETSQYDTWSSQKINNMMSSNFSGYITSGVADFTLLWNTCYQVGNLVYATAYGKLTQTISSSASGLPFLVLPCKLSNILLSWVDIDTIGCYPLARLVGVTSTQSYIGQWITDYIPNGAEMKFILVGEV